MANRFRRVLEELGRIRSGTPQRGLFINSNVALSSLPANHFLKTFHLYIIDVLYKKGLKANVNVDTGAMTYPYFPIQQRIENL
jgi:hypothetical protein